MNLIEKLGLEKCKQIVDGAPAIANHERTDTCSDIANHISPRTTVIDK